MCGMDRDWTRVSAAIKRYRKALGITQDQLAIAAGVSRSSVQALERGRLPESGEAPPSLGHIERVFGWPAGTGIAIAEGADVPEPTGELHIAAPVDAAPGWADRLPALLREELEAGHVLDSDLIDLGSPGSGLKLVVMAVSEDDESELTPEQVQEAKRLWQSTKRSLWRAGLADSD